MFKVLEKFLSEGTKKKERGSFLVFPGMVPDRMVRETLEIADGDIFSVRQFLLKKG